MENILTEATLLALQGVHVYAGAKPLLEDVSLTIERGQITVLVGPNGAGKSTILQVAAGVLAPQKGTVQRQQNIRVGYAPQALAHIHIVPLRVIDLLNIPRPYPLAQRTQVLEQMGMLSHSHAHLNSLSGGEMSRVLVAHALLGDPHLLLLDEPAAHMDEPARRSFYRHLRGLASERNLAVFMSSHDLHMVMEGTHNVLCLAGGKIRCQGPPTSIAQDPTWREFFGTDAHALFRHNTT